MNSNKTHLEVFAPNQIESIHASTLWVLENVGVQVKNKQLLQFLADNGASVDVSRSIVKMPPELVETSVKKAPKKFTLFGRSSKYDMKIGEGNMHTHTTGGAVDIIDIDNVTVRKAMQKDIEKMSVLVDALDHVHSCAIIAYPEDAPANVKDVYATKCILKNTEKHVLTTPSNSVSLDYIIKLAETVIGNEEFKKRPIISIGVSPTSPLTFSSEVVEILIKSAKYGIPLTILPAPLAGGTSPITLAGTLVQQNAEFLSGNMIVQLINPGAPTIYGARAMSMDMRTGRASCGIEAGLMSSAAVQLAKHYGIPSDVYGFWSNSKTMDEQQAFEKAFNGIMPALAGADLLSGAGFIDGVTVSYEQMVIDDEAFGMIFRAMRGIKIDDKTLALNVIAEVGPRKHFLTHAHTRNFFRTEHFIPKIFDRSYRSAWEKTGSKDISNVAREKAKKIIGEHQPTSLDREICAKLEEIALEASHVC